MDIRKSILVLLDPFLAKKALQDVATDDILTCMLSISGLAGLFMRHFQYPIN